MMGMAGRWSGFAPKYHQAQICGDHLRLPVLPVQRGTLKSVDVDSNPSWKTLMCVGHLRQPVLPVKGVASIIFTKP